MSKKGLVALLITPVVLLLILNSAFIFATSSSNPETQKLSLNLVKSYEDFNGQNEIEIPITGTPLEMASAAALAYIGEGRVTDSELGDEEGYYEIEITLDDGQEVDVHLDINFNVLSTEWEDDNDEEDDD